jgi:lipopolysaccharide transport system permease protein
MPKVTILQAGVKPQYWQRIRECFQYADLLRMLCYRDLRVRYSQTVLGAAWALMNPVVSVLLLYFVFTVIARVNTYHIPPLLFTMAGLYAWNYFSRVVSEAGGSIIGAQSLVKKIYFPRLIIPLSKALSATVDLLVVLFILVVMIVMYSMPVSWNMLYLIPFTVLIILAGMAFGIWVSALTIRYRDFNHILPLVLRIGIFLSPIAYSASDVPAPYKVWYHLNPLASIIEGIRWAAFDTPYDTQYLWMAVFIIVAALASGIWYFIRMEQYIADII